MYRRSKIKPLVGRDKRDRNEMRNSTEVFKTFAIPSVSAAMNPEKIMLESGNKAKNVKDWGRNDFKAIVLRNMGKEIENDGRQAD
jgi:hypothetical protein